MLDATYDESADAVYIYLCPPERLPVCRTLICDCDLPPGTVFALDLDAEDRVLGIEIVGVAGVLLDDALTAMKKIG